MTGAQVRTSRTTPRVSRTLGSKHGQQTTDHAVGSVFHGSTCSCKFPTFPALEQPLIFKLQFIEARSHGALSRSEFVGLFVHRGDPTHGNPHAPMRMAAVIFDDESLGRGIMPLDLLERTWPSSAPWPLRA